MPADRDVGAFDDRAASYEAGWRGRLHRDIVDRVLDIALGLEPSPRHVLDVGCGTGYLLRALAPRLAADATLDGIDPAPRMIGAATAAAADPRLRFGAGVAEHLPFPDGAMDLVVATTSFDHWADQGAGLGEVARVLRPGGHLVLADLLSVWLAPTLAGSRRGRARTVRRTSALLRRSGLRVLDRHPLFVVVQALSARREGG